MGARRIKKTIKDVLYFIAITPLLIAVFFCIMFLSAIVFFMEFFDDKRDDMARYPERFP